MKKSFIILGFTSAIVAVILAATPLFKISVAPIIIAFISGLIILFLSKKLKTKTKVIQYIFLLVIIALSLTIYKGLVNTSEIENTEQLEQIDKENKDENVGNFKETFEEREID